MPRTMVDNRRCAHDSVGGETVIIDTTSGELLMITGFGSTLWDALIDGIDVDRLVEQVERRYGSDAADAVTAFVGSVRDSGFLVDTADPAEANGGSERGVLAEWPESFMPPNIETYAEIAEIMTMDPIHEVDTDLGWPHADSGQALRSSTAG